MGTQGSLVLVLLILVILLAAVEGRLTNCIVPKASLNRHSFPPDFIFGSAVAAYQVEGQAQTYGRKPSIWDTYAHDNPDRIADGSNGDVAIDFYRRYKSDIKLMRKMHMDAFRFSISWSRLIPNGKVNAGVNLEGVKFYNNLINEIISKGLRPFATIFHWDSPQSLEDNYGGFLNRTIVYTNNTTNITDDFRNYADLCFELFGDRVKHWITLNEPWAYSSIGYDTGEFAPGRCSPWAHTPCPRDKTKTCKCKAGNSGTEPYIVAHNLLLSHAAAVKLYREKYQASQKGSIGMKLNSYWYVPASNSKADQDAAKRLLEFEFGWFMNPLTYGDYPKNMKTLVGTRLPKFSNEESKSLCGSLDFLGLNYYSAYYAIHLDRPSNQYLRYVTDYHANRSQIARNGTSIGPEAGLNTNYIFPMGLRHLLNYTKHTYNNPKIYITENGFSDRDEGLLTKAEAINDTCRTKYYDDHLNIIHQSINEDNVNIKGYFAWSFADNYEWSSGYLVRFGLVYVDYDTMKRTPKRSSRWFANFLKGKGKHDHRFIPDHQLESNDEN